MFASPVCLPDNPSAITKSEKEPKVRWDLSNHVTQFYLMPYSVATIIIRSIPTKVGQPHFTPQSIKLMPAWAGMAVISN
jgi:hypothetical protein